MGYAKIKGSISKVIFAKEPFYIFTVIDKSGKELSVKGEFPDAYKFIPGMIVECSGSETLYRGKPQIVANKILVSTPEDPLPIQGVLTPFVGSATVRVKRHVDKAIPAYAIAVKLTKKFGASVFEKTPEELIAGVRVYNDDHINNILLTSLAGLINPLSKKNNIQEIVDLGFSVAVAKAIAEKIGVNAIEKIRENPFCIAKIDGVSFSDMDKLNTEYGGALDSPDRISSGIASIVKIDMRDGHTYGEGRSVVLRSVELLGLTTPEIMSKIKNNELDGIHVEGSRIYLAHMHAFEVSTCKMIADKLLNNKGWLNLPREEVKKIANSGVPFEFSEEQIDAIMGIGSHSFSVLNGGPGTGKTAVSGALSRLAAHAGIQKASQVICAPTGKAANRASQMTGLDGKTIHRACGFNGEVWKYGGNEKLDAKILFIDEIPMMGTSLCYRILDAINNDIPVVFIGDPEQLQSVQSGNIAIDLRRNGLVPVFTLNQVERTNKLAILDNAYKCLTGEMLEETEGDDSFVLTVSDSKTNIIESIAERVERLIPMVDNPVEDIQVMSPQNNGALGIRSINKRLRQIFNPESAAVAEMLEESDNPKRDTPENAFRNSGKVFMSGDKIMRMRDNDYELDIYNGDVGIVTEANHEFMIVRIDGREITIKDSGPFDLAYASTVHKSQGSEYKHVIVVCADEHFYMLNRNLLFTGMTRAQDTLNVIGTEKAIRRGVERKPPARSSVFSERLTNMIHKMIHNMDVEQLQHVIRTNSDVNVKTEYHEYILKETTEALNEILDNQPVDEICMS